MDAAPTSRKRQQTRERLMDAAYALFAEEGVHATSIEAIAEAAGFTRGAFYSNFASKHELFFALASREWTIRLDIVRRVISAGPSTEPHESLEERVSRLVIEVFTALPDDRQWALVYREFELLAMRDPAIAPHYLANEKAFAAKLAEVLIHAAASVDLQFTIAPEQIGAIMLGVYERATREAILRGAHETSAAIRDEMLATLPALLRQFTRTPADL